jgi:putative membrane protein
MIGSMMYSLFRLLHFAALFLLAGALLIENMAIKPTISGEDARNLAKVDRACGLGALLSFGFGLLLWLWVGKPASFYSANPVFHAKLGLFFLLLALAAWPAVFFHRHRHSRQESIAVPGALRIFLRLELILMLVIPILAFLMARGIGSS